MRSITTAAAFAIAASLAAGDDGKFGKSGTKSSKSGDCTDCSADMLIRSQTFTDLSFETYANDDGVIDQQSLKDFCCNDEEEREAFLQAVEFTVGCLVYSECWMKIIAEQVSAEDGTLTEGEFLTATINALCEAEQSGERQPAGGCGSPEDVLADICAPFDLFGACVVGPGN